MPNMQVPPYRKLRSDPPQPPWFVNISEQGVVIHAQPANLKVYLSQRQANLFLTLLQEGRGQSSFIDAPHGMKLVCRWEEEDPLEDATFGMLVRRDTAEPNGSLTWFSLPAINDLIREWKGDKPKPAPPKPEAKPEPEPSAEAIATAILLEENEKLKKRVKEIEEKVRERDQMIAALRGKLN